MISSALIRQAAHDAGFSLCGIARARALWEHAPYLDEWLALGYDSGMEYMRRNHQKRLDPSLLVEEVKTVVVCAVNYKNPAWKQIASPKIASYAYARDYHATIKEMLSEVLARVREAHPAANGRCFCDTAPLLEKAWAVEAGLGWTGKNSLLVTPRYGSFILLGELVLDMECDAYDAPYPGCGRGWGNRTETPRECGKALETGGPRGDFPDSRGGLPVESGDFSDGRLPKCRGDFGEGSDGSRKGCEHFGEGSDGSRKGCEHFGEGYADLTEAGCGACTRCIDSCPTGAIAAPGMIDTGRCISRLTNQRLPQGASIDPNALNGWIFGCDICQSCCPRNARSPLATDPRFAPVIDPRETTQDFWQDLTEEEFNRIFGDTPMARCGYSEITSRIK